MHGLPRLEIVYYCTVRWDAYLDHRLIQSLGDRKVLQTRINARVY
jgi:hypothetical protein